MTTKRFAGRFAGTFRFGFINPKTKKYDIKMFSYRSINLFRIYYDY